LQKWNSKAEQRALGNARKTFLPQPQFGVLIFSLCGPASKNAADGTRFLFLVAGSGGKTPNMCTGRKIVLKRFDITHFKPLIS